MDESLLEMRRINASNNYKPQTVAENISNINALAKANLLKQERAKKVCTKCGRSREF